MTDRRRFMLQLGLGSTAILAGRVMADNNMVLETDPQASALGFRQDATKVDKSKFPKYAAGEQCGNCVLFQGKMGDTIGPCALFSGKQVSANGWCNAWIKKA